MSTLFSHDQYSSRFSRYGITVFIIFLAIGLTFASLLFVYSLNGFQTAGFPMPMVRDQTGGSPISSWGVLGVEDVTWLLYVSIPLNVIIYSAFLWSLRKVIFRRRGIEREL